MPLTPTARFGSIAVAVPDQMRGMEHDLLLPIATFIMVLELTPDSRGGVIFSLESDDYKLRLFVEDKEFVLWRNGLACSIGFSGLEGRPSRQYGLRHPYSSE